MKITNMEKIAILTERLAAALQKNRVQRARLRAIRQYMSTLSTGPDEWDDDYERGEARAQAIIRRDLNKIMSTLPPVEDRLNPQNNPHRYRGYRF